MTALARGRAGAKVILLGEHVVVHGRPAVAVGIPLHLDVMLTRGTPGGLHADGPSDARGDRLLAAAARAVGLDPDGWVARVRSEIPRGRGLGSSAALCIAMLRAFAAAAGRSLAPADEIELGRELEAIFHGTPSGIDPAVAALGGCVRFVPGRPPSVTPLTLARPLPLVIAFDDTERDTGAAVAGLRARWRDDRVRYEAVFDRVADLVEAGVRAITAGDLPALGHIMTANQEALEMLGVSAPAIRHRVAAACAAGALGAKLTGGGAGGAIIALAPDPTPVLAALDAPGVHTLVVSVTAGR